MAGNPLGSPCPLFIRGKIRGKGTLFCCLGKGVVHFPAMPGGILGGGNVLTPGFFGEKGENPVVKKFNSRVLGGELSRGFWDCPPKPPPKNFDD